MSGIHKKLPVYIVKNRRNKKAMYKHETMLDRIV